MSHDHAPPPPPPERRRFLQWLTHGLGALWAAAIGVPAVAYLIDARNRPARNGDFKSVARLDSLQKDVPVQAVIRDQRRDAWTLHPNDLIGRVWLIRRDGNKVQAFTTICPHLGCSINYEDKAKLFICPCHNGSWDSQCKLVTDPATLQKLGIAENPAPRDMDELDVKVEGDQVLVKYENFISGRHDKVVKS